MASNIKAKNFIYSQKSYDGMPYPSYDAIAYSETNQYLNSLALGNTYN